MSRPMQTLTLGVALGAAVMAGSVFVGRADASRAVAPAEHGIGYVDVFGLVDQIVLRPDPSAARVAFEAEGQQEMQRLQGEMMAMQAQVQQADPNAPGSADVYAQAQQLQQQMQQFYQQYQYDMQSLIAGQIGDAYKQVHEAARAVASERSIPFVFATRPDSNLLQTDSITGVAQEILARPLIAPPASVDLTQAVRDRLGLPEPTETDASVIEGVLPGQPAPEEPDAGGHEELQPAVDE